MINSLRRFRQIGFFISLTALTALWLTTGCGLVHGGGEENFEFTDVPEGTGSNSVNSGGSSTNIIFGPKGGDVFGPDEQVVVIFSGIETAIPPHQERIKDDGTITLQLIGPVKALGKTPGELQKEIRQLYVPKYYNQSLNITVTGEQRYFFVQGRVRSPNRYPYLGEMTVTKAIAAAGDFDEFANRKNVSLTRANGKRFTVNCVKALNDSSLDLKVYPGDKIVVQQRYW